MAWATTRAGRFRRNQGRHPHFSEILTVTGGTEEVHYTYDALYRQVTLTDGNQHTTHFAYDSKGRLSLIRYPLATAETGYDTVRFTLYDDPSTGLRASSGRLLRRVDGRDVVTDYTYAEAGGNLTLIHYPASSSLDVTFGYDALGRRTAMANNEAAHTYAYDDLGNLLSQSVTYTGLPAQTLSYTYHPNGSRNTFTTPGGTQTYHYDGAGRLTSQVYGLGTASWQYLDNGLLAKQTLPNGAYTDYAYNVANQLTGLANKAPDDSAISTYGSMAYLGTGDLRTVTSTIPSATSLAGVVDYSYDGKRELTDEDSTRNGGYDFGFTFDNAGNPTGFKGTAHTYNADNQLTGPESYVYDGNGNPTTWQGTALSWDPENRMLACGNILTAGHRGDGLRAWKQTSSGRTYFLYDGINIVCELDSDGDLVAESVFAAAGLLSRGAVQYQFDPLGDAVHQLDASGAVTANRLFDAWGNELTSGTGPHGYRAQVGYYADQETGLVSLTFRYYAPGAGRFVNRDPISYAGGVGLYYYVANSPLVGVDRAGLARRVENWFHGWIECPGQPITSAGLYPDNSGWPGSIGMPISGGMIMAPDKHEGHTGDVIEIDDPVFDRIVQDCLSKQLGGQYPTMVAHPGGGYEMVCKVGPNWLGSGMCFGWAEARWGECLLKYQAYLHRTFPVPGGRPIAWDAWPMFSGFPFLGGGRLAWDRW